MNLDRFSFAAMTAPLAAKPECRICGGTGWVDEDQPGKAWHPSDPEAGVGAPCQCNPRGAAIPGSLVLASVYDCSAAAS